MRGMAEEQLRTLIEGIRTRLHEELEVQLGAMSDTHARAVAQARAAAEADAEGRWSARVQAVQAEWQARLASELAAARSKEEQTLQAETARVRTEAEQTLQAETTRIRAQAEQTLQAETTRVRAEAEQEAAEAATMARQELEQDLAVERKQVEEALGAERRRVAELEADRHRLPTLEAELRVHLAEVDAQRQQAALLEAHLQQRATALDEARQRIAVLEAELPQRASEHDRDRQRAVALDADLQQRGQELDAQRRRIAELEAERHAFVDAQAERERSALELQREREALAAERAHSRDEAEEERRALVVDRERTVGELATLRGRIAELESEGERLDLDLRRIVADLASGREHAARELQEERQRAAEALAEARAAATVTPPQPAAPAIVPGGTPAATTTRLLDAMRAMDQAATLTEVLAAAARGAAAEAPRAAMFLVQGAELREWPVAGVPSFDSGPLRVGGREAGVIAEAIRRHEPASTGGGDEGATVPHFASLPPAGVAIAVPLILGGTPVAVLYADQGLNGQPAGSWQEHVQLLGFHAAACAASLTAVRTAQAMRVMEAGESAGKPAPDPGQDAVHAARRYARLLVSEIKLYNENAVRLGRERRDLLVRLEPEIERARRLYDERVAPSVHGRDMVFQQELAQTLADGDPSLLGVPGHQQSSC